MADYDERSSEDLTEEPSAYRLEEMRQKGEVAYSRELTSTVVFLVCACVIYWMGVRFAGLASELMKDIFSQTLQIDKKQPDLVIFSELLNKALNLFFQGFAPLGGVAVCAAILISVAQTQGLVVNWDAIQFNLAKLDPVKGFKKIFSAQNLFSGVKSVFKLGIIISVVYSTIKGQLLFLPSISGESESKILAYSTWTTMKLCFVVGFIMIAIGGVDFFFQWMNFRKQARTTKAEAKQEMKEREGDPQIKARIRSIQREMARKRMMKSVPKADVIITNPTHISIAIQYEKDFLAPKVVAKGADFMAEKIREIAKQNGIPLVENKPLARNLYKTVKVGQYVPRSLYQAVAEILAYVYKLRPKNVFSHQK